ncbi:hypothetical protein LCGC14_0326160 [marine sediment metagenome]|uniref:Sialidase domain-containing protein n=1 Tax=marine sediment metagenome TaxID=412755 RepID=A0A0F9THY5_9ZZZZ
MKLLALLTCLLGSQNYTTVANHGPAGTYCAFPGACRMADGRIIVVFYNGTGHVTRTDQRKGGGAIAYTISGDEGRTWSEPAMLLDTEEDDRDPSISLLRDGRLMLSYFRLGTVPVLTGDGVYIAEIVAGVETRDGGSSAARTNPGTFILPLSQKTFNSRHVRKLQHDAGTSSPVRDFGNGLLMLGSYHIDQPYVIRSADNGKTWQVFDIPNGGKHLDAETDIIELVQSRELTTGESCGEPPGSAGVGSVADAPSLGKSQTGNPSPAPARFYAVMRGHNCNGHYSTSNDGKNWTVAEDIGFPLHCPVLHRVQLDVEKGRGEKSTEPGQVAIVPKHPTAILLAHRVPATALHYSLDECKTWKGPIQIDSCGGAYPCFVTCRDGSVLVIYYTEGTSSHIRCRRFTVSKKGISWQELKKN